MSHVILITNDPARIGQVPFFLHKSRGSTSTFHDFRLPVSLLPALEVHAQAPADLANDAAAVFSTLWASTRAASMSLGHRFDGPLKKQTRSPAGRFPKGIGW